MGPTSPCLRRAGGAKIARRRGRHATGRSMHKYRIVNSAVHAGIAALCWMVLKHINELETYIENYKPILTDYKGFAVPALIAGLALLFRISDALSNAIVEKMPPFSTGLRRLLSGREYIEGDWPLVVVDMAQKELLYLGFLTISFKKGQIYVYGNDWNPDGSHAMEFESKQSLYEDRKLQYWYEQGASLHDVKMRGYTEIFFFPRAELAERHAGKFLDVNHLSDIRFYAVRQKYGLFQRRFRSKQARIAAAIELWNELAPRLDELEPRSICTDFE